MNTQKRRNRRVVYFVAAVSLILLLVGGGYLVYAAMTAQDKKVNDFQIGQVETKIEEVFDERITEIPKDQSIEKNVTIKNMGTMNQFVRVMVLPEVKADVSGDSHKQVLPLVVGTDLILEGMDTDEWKAGGDGYYYYVKEALEPKSSSSSLFQSIKLSNNLSDNYHEATFALTVKVETINCNEAAYQQAWWQGYVPTQQPLQSINDALKTKVDN